MPDFDVRLEAVQRLRQSLLRFANQQQSLLAHIEQRIVRVQAALGQAEQHWRRTVDLCQRQADGCYAEAAYAATQGIWLDCSGDQQALYAAETKLATVLRMQYQLAQQVAIYQQARIHLQDRLEFDVSRAVTFLDNILAGLEAVLDLRSVAVPPPTVDLTGITPTQIFFYDASSEIGPPISIKPMEKKEGDFGNVERKG
ncbi:MAG: hypothetical protein U0350_26645 [Caldilineaceae bacterium]